MDLWLFVVVFLNDDFFSIMATIEYIFLCVVIALSALDILPQLIHTIVGEEETSRVICPRSYSQ